MRLSAAPSLDDLNVHDRGARRAWLEAVAGCPLSSEVDAEAYEKRLRRAVRCVMDEPRQFYEYETERGRPWAQRRWSERRIAYTVPCDGRYITVRFDNRSRSVRARIAVGRADHAEHTTRRLRPENDHTDDQRLAALFLSADNHVARCERASCRAWFPRKTTKQRFCDPRCANAERQSRDRRKRKSRRMVTDTSVLKAS